MADASTAHDIDRIAATIDWTPTCLPGDEHRTIVRMVLEAAAHQSRQPAQRPNLDGIPADQLTELDALAYAYPEVHALRVQLANAQAANARVRKLHTPDQYGDCPACGLTSYEDAIPWKDCATTAALDGAEDTTAAQPAQPVTDPDYVEDGVQGWLVGNGLDVERDATGPATSIRIGGAEQPVRRVRALRDALSAALDGDVTEEG